MIPIRKRAKLTELQFASQRMLHSPCLSEKKNLVIYWFDASRRVELIFFRKVHSLQPLEL